MIAAVVEIVAEVIDTLPQDAHAVVLFSTGETFVNVTPPEEYEPDAAISSVPRLLVLLALEPGVPMFVIVAENVVDGDPFTKASLNTSPATVKAETAAVEFFDIVNAVAESTEATTAPAATLVPVTAMPTAIAAVEAIPVIDAAPEVLVPVVANVACMQCAACKNSTFAELQTPVVAISCLL
jgi:hypothetical protein